MNHIFERGIVCALLLISEPHTQIHVGMKTVLAAVSYLVYSQSDCNNDITVS